LLNSDIRDLMRSKGVQGLPIYADSAEPKSIQELRRYGFNIRGVDKGRDSISYGIDLMQQQDFKVTSSSTNLIKELRSYVWDTDKTGKTLNKPIGALDHGIDAMRYFTMMHFKKKTVADIR